MRQLDINGAKTKISLTTLEKKDSLVDSFLVHDLEVTDLDENYIVKLPISVRPLWFLFLQPRKFYKTFAR